MNDALQPVNPLSERDWDVFVRDCPGTSLFHSAGWARVLADTYGFSPNYFVIRDRGGIQSLLPLMEVNSWLTGRRGVALPFTDHCEPIGADAARFKSLFQAAVQFGKTRRWKHVECRGGSEFFGRAEPSLAFWGHQLDLVPGERTLWKQLDSPVRRAIRKAEKEQVHVNFSNDLAALKTFYSLQCLTRKRHGLPPQPFLFFLNIHRHILSQNQGMIAVARWQNHPIAAALYFHQGSLAIFKFGASDEASQHLRGPNLVMWEAIKHYCHQGMTGLDFGKTSMDNVGLRRFKLGWGATERNLEYFKYDLQKECFVADQDDVSGWHNQIFRKLPIFASRMVGKVLYRHWA